ncbi:unnamed protein product [Blepharisma stoltei]|uniref:Uncharacterized protein n=1 Tax=Blepharisma stoltei TaxID=1481888 RepID=A0AAU9JZY2_9CILI|nr:unnamed protein product [Blepharisma stoltei]
MSKVLFLVALGVFVVSVQAGIIKGYGANKVSDFKSSYEHDDRQRYNDVKCDDRDEHHEYDEHNECDERDDHRYDHDDRNHGYSNYRDECGDERRHDHDENRYDHDEKLFNYRVEKDEHYCH